MFLGYCSGEPGCVDLGRTLPENPSVCSTLPTKVTLMSPADVVRYVTLQKLLPAVRRSCLAFCMTVVSLTGVMFVNTVDLIQSHVLALPMKF